MGADAATLTLAWDPPTDTLAVGYIVQFGKTPGRYTDHVDAGSRLKYAVDGLADGTTYCFAVQAYDASGARSALSSEVCGRTPEAPPPSGTPPPPPSLPPPPPPSADPNGATDVVMYASNAVVIKGNWAAGASARAAGGGAMRSVDRGWSAPNAPHRAPAHHFDLTFTASANTPYTIWVRLRAGNDSRWNDSVWVQFSDALVNGRAKYRIGTTSALLVNLEPCAGCGTSGWGWHNSRYWQPQEATITFVKGGTHTVRVQTREDGVEIDQIVLSPSRFLTAPPGLDARDTTILPESPTAGGMPDPNEIVMHATDAHRIVGNWTASVSSGAAGGRALRSANQGWAAPNRPLASPANAFDLTFNAAAKTTYRLWVRLRAGANSKWNDSIWVQFSDALANGQPRYRLGTTDALLVNLEGCITCKTSGWGWHNTAYWLPQVTTLTFARSGSQTIRVQIREDGVEIDQIVLSASKYKTAAPGSARDDATTLAKSAAASSRAPYTGTPIAIPGNIDAADFDHGGANVAYVDTSPGNGGGTSRATDVDLQASSEGGYNIGWTAAGEWVTYTVDVAAAGVYTARLRVASVGGGALQVAAGLPSRDARDIAVPDTRSWQSWTTVTVPLTLAAGQQTLTVRFLTAGVNLRSISLQRR